MSKVAKRWTPEEDQMLLRQVSCSTTQGKARDWTAIAAGVPGRSNKDCRKRWCNHLVGGLRKGSWETSEDRILAASVEQYGFQWALVAEEVGTRSADQCAKRWQHSLDPSLDHSKWTTQESKEKELLEAVEKHGRAWKQIQTQYFPNRATNNVKNRYVTLARKREAGADGRDTPMTDSESATAASPSCATVVASVEETSSLYRSDAASTTSEDRKDRGEMFDLGMLTNMRRTTPFMSLGMPDEDGFTNDMSLDFGEDYNPMADSSPSRSLHNQTRSHGSASQSSSNTRFDSAADKLSALMNMDFLPTRSAQFVLTIDNPSPETITKIIGILIQSDIKFRTEMK
ncbi:myb transcription protein [Diplodia corticola]|uniref:Myb transcription protein n=1 Tax=Diplodia corticola TaxID=236234 RepID=A0A1J9QVW4_9PEZI|nr:myb transcription protein [Diplodia corticola]OJD32138.1 myb transcription protein [Diplodia corticola]